MHSSLNAKACYTAAAVKEHGPMPVLPKFSIQLFHILVHCQVVASMLELAKSIPDVP